MKTKLVALLALLLLIPLLPSKLLSSKSYSNRPFESEGLLSTPIPLTPTPSIVDLSNRIDNIERTLGGHEILVEVQSNTFNATVSRMESNLNLLLTIIGIVSILIALLGYGVVRMWIRSQVEQRIKGITSEEISRLSEDEVSRLREEWEPKFRDLYDEYQGIIRNER